MLLNLTSGTQTLPTGQTNITIVILHLSDEWHVEKYTHFLNICDGFNDTGKSLGTQHDIKQQANPSLSKHPAEQQAREWRARQRWILTRDTQREEWEKSDVWKVSVRCAMWAGGCAGLELHGPEWTSPRRASKRPHRGVIHETVSNKQCRKWSKMTCTREDRLLCRRFPASVAVNKCLFLLWICRLEYIDWGHSIL